MKLTNYDYFIPCSFIKFLTLMHILINVESLPTHSNYPEYLRVSSTKDNKLLAILKKSPVTEEGYPVWTTPDKETMKISMKSTEIPEYNLKLNKWVFVINHNKMLLIFESPAHPPFLPHLPFTHIWRYNGKPITVFRIERSEEKEYKKLYIPQRRMRITKKYGRATGRRLNIDAADLHDIKYIKIRSGHVVDGIGLIFSNGQSTEFFTSDYGNTGEYQLLNFQEMKPNKIEVEWLPLDPWYGSIITSLTFINTASGRRKTFGYFPYNKRRKGVRKETVDIVYKMGFHGVVGSRGLSFAIETGVN